MAIKDRLPTAQTEWAFYCFADSGYFLPWEEVPESLKDELDANGGLPCDASGAPGPWCMECRFGGDEEMN
jgi:hypothetical protein